MSKIRSFIDSVSTLIGESKRDELLELWEELSLCPILLQLGKRKSRPCHKPCLRNKLTCSQHANLHMCIHEHCLHKCEEGDNICEFHKKEDRKLEEAQRVYPIIRWIDPFFIIKGTNIILDIDHHIIVGYKKDSSCISEETEEIKEACRNYSLRFVSRD